MNVDYRVRCAVPCNVNGLEYQRIFYGLDHVYVSDMFGDVIPIVIMPQHYPVQHVGEQYKRGKLPGSPEPRVQCFFNQRIV